MKRLLVGNRAPYAAKGKHLAFEEIHGKPVHTHMPLPIKLLQFRISLRSRIWYCIRIIYHSTQKRDKWHIVLLYLAHISNRKKNVSPFDRCIVLCLSSMESGYFYFLPKYEFHSQTKLTVGNFSNDLTPCFSLFLLWTYSLSGLFVQRHINLNLHLLDFIVSIHCCTSKYSILQTWDFVHCIIFQFINVNNKDPDFWCHSHSETY